nr:hypothetical protein [Tanacetum cinerariifolium]
MNGELKDSLTRFMRTNISCFYKVLYLINMDIWSHVCRCGSRIFYSNTRSTTSALSAGVSSGNTYFHVFLDFRPLTIACESDEKRWISVYATDGKSIKIFIPDVTLVLPDIVKAVLFYITVGGDHILLE